ncbi:PhnD/SsuA/transferrin family substrate-binding protein [Mycobacterium sp. 48b]|uniref:PhnD/SsuA/transferrin family substrate-binding protein n=1 Tax=Mycobacterium sp. 48b TaxID=3400426 RepID=UPI003AAAEEBE
MPFGGRAWRGSAALLLIPLLLSACGLSDDEAGGAIDTVNIAAKTEVPPGTKLVVAEQNGTQSLPWNLANAGQGTPYEVDFADFSGGAAVIEALRSGAADVGSIGEAPVPIAVDSGVTDLVTIGLQANPGTSGGYYLVARPDSGVRTIEDLRGKRVAYPPGSGRHMVTAGLLKRHGLDLRTDVQPVELAGAEVVPTFAAGAVEAAIVLGNQYYQLGEPPILGDGKGINTGIQTLIVRRDVLDDPAKVAAIGDYVGRAVAANNWKDTHADEWIDQYYVKVQGITFDQGKKLYEEDGIASYYPIDADSTALFQTVADGLHETGTIKGRVDVEPYVDGRYNDIVSAQNELDGVTPKSLKS